MQNETQHIIDTIVIGAGLTGLTTAHTLRKHGKEVVVLEKTNRIGGQIQTHRQDGFTFESGPNTGVVAILKWLNYLKNWKRRLHARGGTQRS